LKLNTALAKWENIIMGNEGQKCRIHSFVKY